MEIVETEHFYQLKSDGDNYGTETEFIVGIINELWGQMFHIRFENDRGERLSLTFSNVTETMDWIKKRFWVKITVTVLK